MLRKVITAALVLAIGAGLASAEQKGRGSRTDHRVRTLTYNPDEVYRIDAHTGYVVTVLFEPGEVIMDGQLGDTKSWATLLTASADGFTFKPKFLPPQPTNMMIQTDRRTYIFLFEARQNKNPANVGFLYRFKYPGTGRGAKMRPATTVQAAYNRSNRQQNLQYSAAGDKILRPEVAFDDGRKTYLRLNGQSARPAVFALEADGRERLVNTADLADGTIVVTGVYPRLVLRDGPYVVCIFNNRLYQITENRDSDRIRRTASASPRANGTRNSVSSGENR